MYYVYLLRSLKDGKLYIGFTNNLGRRLKEHGEGHNFSTQWRRPFELVYYEAYKKIEDAKERECQLKRYSQGLMQLKRRLKASLDI